MWTTEAPAAPGFYWLYVYGCVELAHVSDGGDHLYYSTCGYEQPLPVDGSASPGETLLWQGPIPEPPPPDRPPSRADLPAS